ncbi:MAG: hypothetical protein GY779_06570 [Gammaproteobacteria bacterium]|nr:hypothetical protein [Gammaproteobacteria bacterium]
MSFQPKTIPFGSFAPDQSDYDPSLADNVIGAMPITNGWGPIAQFSEFGSGLPTACRGYITVRTTAGGYASYAGTATKLYKYNTGTSSWDEKTWVSGDYTTPSGYNWSFFQFGNTLIACNGVDSNQSVDVDSTDVFAALAGSPPIARYVSGMGEHVVLSNFDAGNEPRSMQVSGYGNAEYWTDGQQGSDKQEFPIGGELTGFWGHEHGGVVFQRNMMQAVTLSSDSNYTFDRHVIQNNIGSIGEPSIIKFRNTFFFLSDGGFYQGPEATPIGDEWINRYLLEKADLTALPNTVGASDPINKIAWWIYLTNGAKYEMIGYNWVLNQWCMTDMLGSASAMIPTFIASGNTPGYTLEGLDAISSTIEGLPYSLDSRAWKGGQLALAGFSSTGAFGFSQGGALQATFETNDVALIPGRRSLVQGFRLVSDAGTNVTGKIAGRDAPGQSLEWSNAITPNSNSQKMTKPTRGRTHRIQATIAESTEWSHVNGVEVLYKQAGNR